MRIKTLALAALVAALLVGSVTPTHAKEEPAPACAPLETGAPRTINGTGQRSSAPFRLEGGAYRVDWAFTSPATQLSFVNLKPADDSSVLRLEVILNGSPAPGATSGETYLYSVKPGPYYLDVRAPAGWSVTLTPIAV